MTTITNISDDQINLTVYFTDFPFSHKTLCSLETMSAENISSVSIINTELIPTYEIKWMTEKCVMLDNKYITGI